MKARYHRQAREELAAAVEWYEARRPGLGLDFITEVTQALALIREHPETWPRWPGIKAPVTIRRFALERFPFALPYLIHEGVIVVLAIAHGRRRPGYWRARIRDAGVG